MSKRLIGWGVLLVGLLAAYLILRSGPRLSEEARVTAAVERARQGVVKHRVSEIMASVSHSYDDGNYTHDTFRTMLIYGLSEYRHLEVVVYPKQIDIKGTIAIALLDVKANGERKSGGAAGYHGVLRVYFQREPSRRDLFFPDHAWRAVRVENLSDVEGAFEQ